MGEEERAIKSVVRESPGLAVGKDCVACSVWCVQRLDPKDRLELLWETP